MRRMMRSVQITLIVEQTSIERQALVSFLFIVDDVDRATDFLCEPDCCAVTNAEIKKSINTMTWIIRHFGDLAVFFDCLQFFAEDASRHCGNKTTLKFLVVLFGRHAGRCGLQFLVR